jgi:hypothetical protein
MCCANTARVRWGSEPVRTLVNVRFWAFRDIRDRATKGGAVAKCDIQELSKWQIPVVKTGYPTLECLATCIRERPMSDI